MLYKLMVGLTFNLEAVKLCLITGQKKLFPLAVENLAQLPQVGA